MRTLPAGHAHRYGQWHILNVHGIVRNFHTSLNFKRGFKCQKSLKIGMVLMLILGLLRIFASIQMVATGEKNLDSGVLFALNGIAIIGITLGAYRKGEKWSWWTLLIIVMTVPIYCNFAHGWLAWNIVGLVLSTLPVVIPAKSDSLPKARLTITCAWTQTG